MRRIEFLLLLGLLYMDANAYTGFGVCNFGKETLDTMICYGPALLKGTTVNGSVKVAGSFQGADITMIDLTVQGAVEARNTTVKGVTKVTGRLHAVGVTFDQQINIISEYALFNHSTIKNSIIMSAKEKPILRLECGTTVEGSVVFEDAAGIVQTTNDSAVKGKIINGTMEFVEQKCE